VNGVAPEQNRRARHEELNRSLLLDAAEEAFGERGYAAASIRDIARRAGFSSAALYLFFSNKADLYREVLVRRGRELHDAMRAAAGTDKDALDRLRDMADVALDFYGRHPSFARLVAQTHTALLGTPLSEWQQHVDERVRSQFHDAMENEAEVIREGQRTGHIRPGDPFALAYIFSTLVNTHLAVGAGARDGGLSVEQLHDLIASALRAPAR
jgi:TetR/AcrR family transcriptional regulator